MGVVYAAYDPELDRRVAIKLLRPDAFGSTGGSVGEARLVREARAMAKLAAPNVITVHDIGILEDQVYVAMEFIDGLTLSDWWDAHERTWQEVVDVFRSAGRGLAAAHAAGLIHRDFKPDNVMLAKDGRILVMDFGLVRESDEEPEGTSGGEDIESSYRPEDSKLTRAGAVMGTPAYMAPEQHLGLRTDARTDQFSFCVALYEGLFGTRPFRGESLAALAFQVTEGNVQPTPAERHVPAWLRKLVTRGLSAQPDDRYPSMTELLEQLDRDPNAARRRWLGFGTLGVLTASLVFMAAREDDAATACAGAADKLVGIWDDAKRAEAKRAFETTDVVYAADTWTRVEKIVDDYAAGWVDGHTDACEATTIRGEQSAAMMDKRMACLGQRLQAVEALVDVYADADAALVPNAVAAASTLPRLDSCADAVFLEAEVRPPEDGAVAARVEALREQLVTVQALESAGRYPAALEIAGPVLEESKTLGYRPLEAEAAYQVGLLNRDTGDFLEAEELLREAVWAGRASRNDRVAAKATVELVGVVGFDLGRARQARIWLEAGAAEAERDADEYAAARLRGREGLLLDGQGLHAEAMEAFSEELALLEKSGRENPIDLAVAHNNLGAAAYAAGRYDRASDAYTRALELSQQHLGDSHPTVAVAFGNLGLTAKAAGELLQAREYRERALALKEEVLPADHPSIAYSLDSLGAVLLDMGEPDQARHHFERAVAIRIAKLGPDHPDVAHSLSWLGAALREQGELQAAFDEQTRALAIAEAARGPAHPSLASYLDDLGVTLLELSRPDDARVHLIRALALRKEAHGPEHPYQAASLLHLARASLAQGDAAGAIAHLRRAMSLSERPTGRKELLPDIRSALARALDATRDPDDEVETLIQRAMADYEASGRRDELEELRKWSSKRQATAERR
jgi:tetratricopeptide (TPR) repeat protein